MAGSWCDARPPHEPRRWWRKKSPPSPRPSPPGRGGTCFRVSIVRMRWICLGSGAQCANGSGNSHPGRLLRGEGEAFAVFSKNPRLDWPKGRSQNRRRENGKSSPGGEDTGEGGRQNKLDGTRAWVWRRSAAESQPQPGSPSPFDGLAPFGRALGWPCCCGWSLTQPRSAKGRARSNFAGTTESWCDARPHHEPRRWWRKESPPSPRPSPPGRGGTCFRVSIVRMRRICLGSGAQCANGSGNSHPGRLLGGEGEAFAVFSKNPRLDWPTGRSQNRRREKAKSSPGGEDTGEGGRQSKLDGTRAWVWRRSAAESQPQPCSPFDGLAPLDRASGGPRFCGWSPTQPRSAR